MASNYQTLVSDIDPTDHGLASDKLFFEEPQGSWNFLEAGK